MNRCEVMNCGYWYADEGEKFPSCKCDLPEGWAPCEVEENENDDD